jgi:hypothetical protein
VVRGAVVDTAAPQQVELGVRSQTLSRQETVTDQFGKRCVLGVLLFVLLTSVNAMRIRLCGVRG